MKIELIDSSQAAAIDKYTIDKLKIPSLLLMEEAAKTAFNELIKDFNNKARFLIVCASGNNGADGLALARMLYLAGYKKLDVLLLGHNFTSQNKTQQEYLKAIGLSFYENVSEIEKLSKETKYDCIVDALFGVGLKRNIEGDYKKTIDLINDLSKEKGSYIVALDLPSGLDASTSKIYKTAVKANKTICFGYDKIGLYCGAGPLLAGEIITTPIALNDTKSLREIASKQENSEFESFKTIGDIKAVKGNILKDKDEESKEIVKCLDSRVKAGNKGSYGKALIIAGSKDIGGAVILASKTAARMGLGMVKCLTHISNRDAILNAIPECLIDCYDDECSVSKLKEAVAFADVVVLGPGLSMNDCASNICKNLLEIIDKPLIIDADALNIIARDKLFDRLKLAADRLKGRLVVTPHLKEMERLTGIKLNKIKEDPLNTAKDFSDKYHVICCLKDAKTVVSDGKKAYINQAGNDGMATAGSGDVLAGVLAGIFAYKFEDPLLAAITAVNLHANAGDLAAKNLSKEMMLSGDIIRYIDEAMKER